MKSKKQEIKIIRENGTIRMVGNGDAYMWQLANGMYHKGQISPRKRDIAKKFVKCLFRAIRLDAHEKMQKIEEAIVGTEEAAGEMYKISGYLN